MPGPTPSWYLGVNIEQPAGSAVVPWGLDATKQLGSGQTVTAPVCTVTDLGSGADVSTTLLSGSATVGPNAAGTAGTVVTQAITGATLGARYRLTCQYTPSPPSPSGEKLELVLDFSIVM